METPFNIENNMRVYDFKKSWQYLEQLGQEQFGAKFKLDPKDKKVIYKLIIYFIQDKENCLQHGIDLNKGILLNGPVGCGKTTLMQLMRKFAHPKYFTVKSTRDIAAQFNIDGYSVIQHFGRSNQAIFCFDDLGVESNMKYYGSECNTISEVLLQRYDLFVAHGTVTHATTNLNAQELEKLYGNRVRSRMRELFNLISFDRTTPDKRR